MSIVVLAAVAGVCALYQINTQLRQYVLTELEKRFPDLEIEIGKVSLDEQRGVSIRHFECSIPSEPGIPKRPLLLIDEMYLDCPVTIQTLYKKEVRIKKISIRNPIVRLTRSTTGRFEEIRRLQSSGEAEHPVPIEIYNGIILYEDLAVSHSMPLRITGVSTVITPPDTGNQPALLTDLEKKTPPGNAWKIIGAAKGDLFRQLDFEGHFDPAEQNWEISATCRQFDWTPDLLDHVPLKKPLSDNPEHQKSLESFQGRFDLALHAQSDKQAPNGVRFSLDGVLSQGRAELYEIRRTLSELNTRFHVTEDSLHIEKLTGIGEAARLIVSYRQEGLLKPRQALLSADIRGLTFDVGFVGALSPLLNENTENLLKRFDYGGTTDLNVDLALQNGSWKPRSLVLKLSDLHFTFLEFPYKVERLSGDLTIDASAVLRLNLAGRHDDPLKTRIVGEYRNIFDDPAGQVRIQGQDVPIDAKLMNTIPASQREVVRSLQPTGKINADLLIALPPGDLPIEKHFGIGLNNVSVQYERFPYPLQKIFGCLYLNDDVWTFENLVGTGESATVKCDGHLRPVSIPNSNASAMEFQMSIHAEELPVDGQLADALLDPGQRDLLTGLRARGKVNLAAQIRYLSGESMFNLEFEATPLPGLSINPTRFPYQFDNVQGTFEYKDGVVKARQMTAQNRETRLSAGVFCQFASHGRWMMRLSPLDVEQLPPTRELLDAMPPNLRNIFDNLDLTKPFNLSGLLEFSQGGESAPFRTVWDLGVVLHQNSAVVGIPIQDAFGSVRLTGFSENNEYRLAGELKLDSATIRGFQVTDLSGPFFFDGNASPPRFYLGQPAQKELPPPPDMPQYQAFRQSPWFARLPQARPITGTFAEGTWLCEGLAVLGNSITYSIHTDLIGASLARIAREVEPGVRQIAGTLNWRSQIWGDGNKLETMGGKGSIELRNANIYEAPGMIRLLRELSIRDIDPNAGTFSSADIRFGIQGKRMIFDPITFEGGAFSLTGSGDMMMDTRVVNLIMKTRLGNRRTQIPIVGDILSGAGDQIIQLNVQGPISDPTVSRVALPEIQKAIRHIQGEETTDFGGFVAPTLPKTSDTPSRLAPSKILPWK